MQRLTPLVIIALLLMVSVAGIGATQASSQRTDYADGTFLTAPSADDAETIARRYILEHAADLGISAADANADGWVLQSVKPNSNNELTFVYMRQAHEGITVHNAIVNFGIMGDGSILHVGNRAVPNLIANINTTTPAITAEQAIVRGAEGLGLEAPTGLSLIENRGGVAQEVVYSDGGISQEPIPAKLVYQPLASGEVRLAWDIVIYELSSLHWWQARVDAVTGQLLDRNDWVVNENLDVSSDEVDVTGYSHSDVTDATDSPIATGEMLTGSYRVIAFPFESPNHTTPALPADGRTLVVNPANALASPYGWHDTNGASGAEFTITRGNNVYAALDLVAPNGADVGTEPDGGAGLVFDYPADFSQGAATYRPAVVTNLFYWNNIIHDVMYQYGFDEASGNFQANNYGRGGLQNDFVQAEAQDYSGTNNANFATPADGQRPRMQMYIWTAPLTVTVEILTPASLAGTYYGSKANFGPDIDGTGITGTLAVATDGTGLDPFDGCEPFTNAAEVAGKIALVNRGNCTFPIKVTNAQTAGAIAVVVVNNAPAPPGSMAGTGAITIPSVHIFRTLGTSIRTAIAGGDVVTLNMRDDDLAVVERDSDMDSGVIIHEYGHGISNRLTGDSVACLGNEEQMGEGWSDWFGLTMTADANDTGPQRRGVGTYLTYENVDGFGIRPAPYSTDFTINPYTYANVPDAAISVPHGVGFIWSSMIWDMYWSLRTSEGYDPDLYNGTGGNNLALQLVMDGLKLQPCRPGFVDGRDGIIAAAVANGMTQAEICDNIWVWFARRGLGFSATQGDSNSRTDGTAAFDLPTVCDPTAVTMSNLGATSSNVALPVAGIALVGLLAGTLIWRKRQQG